MTREHPAAAGTGVRIERLSKRYGAASALVDVDVEIANGSLVALLGPSGCGKSTLLRIIAGLDRPTSGRVLLGDVAVGDLPPNARDVGVVFQSYALFPHLNVAANVGFALAVRKRPRAEIAARVRELLELVRLSGYDARYPHELSGGQRQRIALARALAARPKLLLLDEPFAALDLAVRKELRGALRALHETTGVTTILVTHDPEEAMELADRLVLLRDGRVAQSGSPEEVYRRPVDPFVMRFLGPVSVLESTPGIATYVRPEDVRVERSPFALGVAGTIERIVHLGAYVRLDVRLHDGQRLRAHVTDERARELALISGGTAHFHPQRTRPFDLEFSEGGGV